MPCKILRIGVFFDGTGNSKIPDSSKGQMSNIAKLSKQYKEEEFVDKFGKKTTSKMLYTNGVGTYDSDCVNFFNIIDRKYDKGGGGGGAERINKMIDDVSALLDEHPYSKSDTKKFTKREIDVFGFSRGAAMARDFVNTFYKKNSNIYPDVTFNFIGIYDTVGSFGTPGNDQDFKPKREYQDFVSEAHIADGFWKGVSSRDFGIRDPDANKRVSIPLESIEDGFFAEKELHEKMEAYAKEGWNVSYESLSDDVDTEHEYVIWGEREASYFFEPYNFDLCADSATKIMHMVAHNEVRKNFPLTNVQDSNGEEWIFIGVHSDIGGGYGAEAIEEFVYDDVFYSQKKANEKAEVLVKSLNINSRLFPELDKWEVIKAESETKNNVTIYHPKLQKSTSNDLSLITLNLMYEQAIKYNVPLTEPIKALPDYLTEYYEYAKINKGRAYTYNENEKGKALSAALLHHPARDPAHKHDHKIATVGLWDAIFRDEPEEGNDARYVDKDGKVVEDSYIDENEKDNYDLFRKEKGDKLKARIARIDHAERAIFDNVPSNAVTKTSTN